MFYSNTAFQAISSCTVCLDSLSGTFVCSPVHMEASHLGDGGNWSSLRIKKQKGKLKLAICANCCFPRFPSGIVLVFCVHCVVSQVLLEQLPALDVWWQPAAETTKSGVQLTDCICEHTELHIEVLVSGSSCGQIWWNQISLKIDIIKQNFRTSEWYVLLSCQWTTESLTDQSVASQVEK